MGRDVVSLSQSVLPRHVRSGNLWRYECLVVPQWLLETTHDVSCGLLDVFAAHIGETTSPTPPRWLDLVCPRERHALLPPIAHLDPLVPIVQDGCPRFMFIFEALAKDEISCPTRTINLIRTRNEIVMRPAKFHCLLETLALPSCLPIVPYGEVGVRHGIV